MSSRFFSLYKRDNIAAAAHRPLRVPSSALCLTATILLLSSTCQRNSTDAAPSEPSAVPVTPSSSAEPPPARVLDVELLYWPGGCNSILVDDDWIYMQAGAGTYRAPKRAGQGPRSADDLADWERLAFHQLDSSGKLLADGGDTVYWSSSEGFRTNAKLYGYQKASGELQTVDLGFTDLVLNTLVTDTHAVVLAVDCVGGAVVNRATQEVRLLFREGAAYSGGDNQAAVAYRDYVYCQDNEFVYRAPLSQPGDFELFATMTTGLQGLFPWGDYLLYAGGGWNHGGAGFISLLETPGELRMLKAPLYTEDSNPIYSARHRTLYWLTRFQGRSDLILLDVDTWTRAQVPMPTYVGPFNGIAQDDEYLYWGENDDSPTLSRTRKLTVTEVKERFVKQDVECDETPPHYRVCWEEPPIPGLVSGAVAPSNVPGPVQSESGPIDAAIPLSSDGGLSSDAAPSIP